MAPGAVAVFCSAAKLRAESCRLPAGLLLNRVLLDVLLVVCDLHGIPDGPWLLIQAPVHSDCVRTALINGLLSQREAATHPIASVRRAGNSRRRCRSYLPGGRNYDS
jgi:hypothetical protein